VTAAFDLIHHADPSPSLSTITQYTTIDIALPTRICSSHVSDSTLPQPHRPSGRRITKTSLTLMAGGTAGESMELSLIPVFLGANGPGFQRCQDTSDPGHFGPKTFQHYQTGAEVSGQFSTSAEVSFGHFGTTVSTSITHLLYSISLCL